MKQHLKYISSVVLAMLVLMTGCEKIIDIPVENQTPLVVVQSHTEAGCAVSLTVTQSLPIFGYHSEEESARNSPFPKVEDATATLTAGGVEYTATRDENVYTFPYIAQSGDRLRLTLEVPGHKTLTAETTVPALAHLGTVSIEQESDPYGTLNFTLHIPLNDPANETNYYSFRLRCLTHYGPQYDADSNVTGYYSCDTDYVPFRCNDQLIVEQDLSSVFMDDPGTLPTFYGDRILVDDIRINGLSHTIDLTFWGYSDPFVHTEYLLEATTHSRDEFLYLKSTASLDDIEEVLSFFSEPVQVHSNIEGGCGLFGAHATLNIPLDDNSTK